MKNLIKMFDINFLLGAVKNFLSKKNYYFLLKEKDGKICIYFSDEKNTHTIKLDPNKWVSINELLKILENGSDGK